jgi:ABC-type multidrug transport system fused ATPase/permease subunit
MTMQDIAADNASADDRWRGVAAEDIEELDHYTGVKLQERSRRLLRSLVRPHAWPTVFALLLMVGESAAQLAGPLLIAAAIDTGIPAAVDGRFTPLALCVVGYLIATLASAGLKYLFLRLSTRIGQDLLLDLRHRVFRHVQRLSVSFHEKYTSGKVISRLTSDLESIDDLIQDGLEDLLSSLLVLLGVCGILIVLDAPLGLLVIVGMVPLVVVTRWYYRASQRTYRGTRGAIAKIIVQYVETMNGVNAVQAFRRTPRNEAIMGDLNNEYREANRVALNLVATYTQVVRLVGNLTLAVVLLIGAWRVVGGGLELGVLTAFTLYLRRVYDPLEDLAMFANSYTSAAAALEKISGLLQEEPELREPERPVPLPPRDADTGRSLELRGTQFRYRADTPVVLHRLDLHVPVGQTLALVGATGAGKSTLAKLIARFYDPTEGSVLLDGVDLRSVADADLRRELVTVTQENFLFAGSVADNIALGRPGASRAEIVTAATAVGAHGFIEALPQGYDTDVRKRGGRLSAGQRQLVAFARVLLADPSVLVLDEATSSLDAPTERAVQAALESVLADRTAVIIAHRLSTVLIADRVLVVDAGRVVEDGSPEELIDAGGEFAALHRSWLESLA